MATWPPTQAFVVDTSNHPNASRRVAMSLAHSRHSPSALMCIPLILSLVWAGLPALAQDHFGPRGNVLLKNPYANPAGGQSGLVMVAYGGGVGINAIGAHIFNRSNDGLTFAATALESDSVNEIPASATLSGDCLLVKLESIDAAALHLCQRLARTQRSEMLSTVHHLEHADGLTLRSKCLIATPQRQ